MDNWLSIYTVARVHQALSHAFAHTELLGDRNYANDFKALTLDIGHCNSRNDFSMRMQEYFAGFQNAHTEFVDLKGFDYKRVHPITPRNLKGDWYVCKTHSDQVNRGDKILKINDLSVDDFVENYVKYVSSSKREHRYFQVFNKQFLLPEKIDVEFSDGKKRTFAKGQQQVDSKISHITFDEVLYIKLPSFKDPQNEDGALDLIQSSIKFDHIIFDLRGNGGGDTPGKLLQKLFNIHYPNWVESTPLLSGLELAEASNLGLNLQANKFQGRQSLLMHNCWTEPDADPFSGKIVCLVDIETGSAAEDFVMPLKYLGRATIIGESTAGSSGQPYFENVHDEFIFSVGAKRQYFPDGSEFEGVGISPDVFIDPLQALVSSNDLALETALKLLKNQ